MTLRNCLTAERRILMKRRQKLLNSLSEKGKADFYEKEKEFKRLRKKEYVRSVIISIIAVITTLVVISIIKTFL